MSAQKLVLFDAYVCPVTCTHCKQPQEVHIRASDATLATPDQTFRCAKCGEQFHFADVPPIYDGPYLPGKGPAPGIARE